MKNLENLDYDLSNRLLNLGNSSTNISDGEEDKDKIEFEQIVKKVMTKYSSALKNLADR